MTYEDKVLLIEDIADMVEGEVYDGYSGRNMYGKTCYGIVSRDPIRCVELAASEGLMGAVWDTMGTQTIVYWPAIRCSKSDRRIKVTQYT